MDYWPGSGLILFSCTKLVLKFCYCLHKPHALNLQCPLPAISYVHCMICTMNGHFAIMARPDARLSVYWNLDVYLPWTSLGNRILHIMGCSAFSQICRSIKVTGRCGRSCLMGGDLRWFCIRQHEAFDKHAHSLLKR